MVDEVKKPIKRKRKSTSPRSGGKILSSSQTMQLTMLLGPGSATATLISRART